MQAGSRALAGEDPAPLTRVPQAAYWIGLHAQGRCASASLVHCPRFRPTQPLPRFPYAAGTTAALCHVHGRRLTAAWVGDSRMVLGLPLGRDGGTNTKSKANSTTKRDSGDNKDGEELDSGGNGAGAGWRVAWCSQDHKPEAPEESARITAAGGRVARSMSRSGPVGPYRVWFAGADYPGLAMSRALGDRPGRQIGITCAPSCAEVGGGAGGFAGGGDRRGVGQWVGNQGRQEAVYRCV